MNQDLLRLLRANIQGRSGRDAIPFGITCQADAPEAADIHITGVISADWGVGSADLLAALALAGGRDATLHVNSPGGDVFEARAMMSAIAAYTGKVHVHVAGMAASAASFLMLAGSSVSIVEGGLVMVHNGWTLCMGNKGDMRSTADLLDKIDASIASDYARKTGKPLADMKAWMDAETWFTGAEALDAGLVDEVRANTQSAVKALAEWDISAYRNAPNIDPLPDVSAAAVAAQAAVNRNRLRLLV